MALKIFTSEALYDALERALDFHIVKAEFYLNIFVAILNDLLNN